MTNTYILIDINFALVSSLADVVKKFGRCNENYKCIVTTVVVFHLKVTQHAAWGPYGSTFFKLS